MVSGLLKLLTPLADMRPEDAEPLLWRLSPAQRAAVLAALMALVLLGIGLITIVYLGGRIVRRRSRERAKPSCQMLSDWDRRQSATDEPSGPKSA